MLDFTQIGMGMLAAFGLLLSAPAWPGACGGTGPGTGGIGGGPSSPPVCGNGVIEEGETCDGSSVLGSKSTVCAIYDPSRYTGGMVKCTDCYTDVSECSRPVCGDGKVEASEMCDGARFTAEYAGKTCSQIPFPIFPLLNFVSGSFSCNEHCQVDFSGCVVPPGCYPTKFGERCF
jgi:hypothetical protein